MSPTRAAVRLAKPLLLAALAGTAPVACRSPLASTDAERLSDPTESLMVAAAARQTAEVDAQPPVAQAPVESEVDRVLGARKAELDAIGPQSATLGSSVEGTVPLTAAEPTRVGVTRAAAIAAAVRNNLEIEQGRLAEAISTADLDRANAAFDFILGAGLGYERTDQPSIGILFPGAGPTPVIPNVTNQRTWTMSGSLTKPLTTGGALSLGVAPSRIENVNSSLYTPDPAWSTAVALGYTQPLLRGFGTDVAEAEIRLAETGDRAANEALRGRMLEVVANTEQAYWSLVSARARLVSAEWLVKVGEEVRDVLAKRREFDATLAQYANAVATVESRKSLVLEARRRLSEAGNTLKLLMNDPAMPVGGEIDVVPADMPSDAAFEIALRGAIETAIAKAPVVRQAMLAIEAAGINETVADNARLPQLDLNTSMTWFGLEDDFGGSFDDIANGDFVSYAAGLQYSYALGNRAAEANYRAARLRRSQAVVAYDQAVQGSVLAVKNALTDVVAFRALVAQNRSFRLAQAENLRALLVEEKTLAALTPEFLQLKFQLQNGLAAAEDAYFASLVGYQSAIAALGRAMGTGLEANGIEFVANPGETQPAGK
ncbi:MAG: TolC family protein [Phycisphaerales bacterium]